MKFWTDTLPRLWWLNPWGTALDLFKTARAMQFLSEIDADEIALHEREIARLRARVEALEADIIAGRAVVPDAEPVAEEGGQP